RDHPDALLRADVEPGDRRVPRPHRSRRLNAPPASAPKIEGCVCTSVIRMQRELLTPLSPGFAGDYHQSPLRGCKEGSLRQTLLQVVHPVRDVGDALLLVADLALDAQRTAVADLLQRPDELLDIGLTVAQRHLLAPLARRRRAVGVLHVYAADVGAENLDG